MSRRVSTSVGRSHSSFPQPVIYNDHCITCFTGSASQAYLWTDSIIPDSEIAEPYLILSKSGPDRRYYRPHAFLRRPGRGRRALRRTAIVFLRLLT
jgi:hypothetical protein